MLLAGSPEPERWTLLQSGAKAGTVEMTAIGKGAYRLRQTYALRGWSDDLRGTLTRDKRGFPTIHPVNEAMEPQSIPTITPR